MKIEEMSAVILAGGRSSRMGTDKARLRLGEKTLLELMVEKVRRLGITEIVVSGCTECPLGTMRKNRFLQKREGKRRNKPPKRRRYCNR